MDRCSAPCTGKISVDGYGDLVEQVRTALAQDVRPAVHGLRERLRRLADEQRFEEAATVRSRLDTLIRTGVRFHRVRSLAACPEIVAARRTGDDWEIHIIRYGRLAAAGVARPGDVPQAVARAVRATAETVLPPVGPLPAAGIEETERIAAWLEQPGSRLMELTGDWAWPLHATLDHAGLVSELGVGT
jgi:DNA polymerase-3 subunit epsilon